MFTNWNVAATDMGHLLLKNKIDLASASMDWDTKHKGTLTCPTKGCAVRIGTYSKLGATVAKENIRPILYVDLKCVSKMTTNEAALTKYAVNQSTIKN